MENLARSERKCCSNISINIQRNKSDTVSELYLQPDRLVLGISTKVMRTYKRKRITSHSHISDGTVVDSSPAASNSAVANSLAPKHAVNTDNNILNEDSLQPMTCAKQQDVYKSMPQHSNEEIAKQSTDESEKEPMELQSCDAMELQSCDAPMELQSCEASSRKRQPETCCTAGLLTMETPMNISEHTNVPNDAALVSSSACDPIPIKGKGSQTEDSNTCAPPGIDAHDMPSVTNRPTLHNNNCSPLLTFHRRVKKKFKLVEPLKREDSKENDKQHPTWQCSSSLNGAPLLNQTGGSASDMQDTMGTVGTSTGLQVVPAECLLEQKCLHGLESTDQRLVPSQLAEGVRQKSPDHVAGPSSELNGVHEITQPAATREALSKTSPGFVTAPDDVQVKSEEHGNEQTVAPPSPGHKVNVNWRKPINEAVADGLLECQGSTKNCPIIVLDDDTNERGKKMEPSHVFDQMVHKKNKNGYLWEQINLNCAELREDSLLSLDNSSVQRLHKDLSEIPMKQMFQPIERVLFTKERDTVPSKQWHEGTSTMPTSYTNFFDPSPSWNAESLKEPRSMSSGLNLRVMDNVRDFNLDLCLDSFPDSSASALRHDKWFPRGTSNGSHMLTERLGTYSYKRRSAHWSEEELDFLWIGVRRYGINNWNAMLRDPRLRFSNSRIAEDLAKQWDKEQRKLLSGNHLQSIRMSALSPPPRMAEDYIGSSSCSGCSKSTFFSAQTDLSLGDMYIRNACIPERRQHSSSLGVLNLNGIDDGPRNLSLGHFPVASTSYARAGSRRQRISKFQNSWLQEPAERSQLLPCNQEPNSGLPHWLRKAAESPISPGDSELWLSMSSSGYSADVLNDGLRAVKPHVLPKASRKHIANRGAERHTFDKPSFRLGDALDLNQRAAAAVGLNGAAASESGASSEETVSDS